MDPLGGDSLSLLKTVLDSFEKLELVRALRTSGRAMSREELSAECRFTLDTVAEALADLARSKVVELDEPRRHARLGPVSREPAFETLLKIYEEDRSFVLSTLSTIVMERIRNMAARAFGDAFVLRKKRGDDDG